MSDEPGPAAPPPPPVAPPAADPLVALALSLDEAEGLSRAQALSDEELARLCALAVATARDAPAPAWVPRLATLRKAALLADQRASLALVLAGIAETCAALPADRERSATRVRALDALVGVRDMLGRPWAAHAALVDLAAAQADAGEPAAAEATLHRALSYARAQAPGGHADRAGACMSTTLVALGQLLRSQPGREAEGLSWLEGAVDMATDDAGRAEAQRALDFARG